jgi:hypothetical protein
MGTSKDLKAHACVNGVTMGHGSDAPSTGILADPPTFGVDAPVSNMFGRGDPQTFLVASSMVSTSITTITRFLPHTTDD